jgi:molybdate transport system substrate-binding protein
MTKSVSYLYIGLVILLIPAFIGSVSALGTNQSELNIFAAASLTGVIGDLNPIFEAGHPGVQVIPNFESSATLEWLIHEGAYADLFLSASGKNIDTLEKKGLIDNTSVIPYTTNKLAIIVPIDNPAGITGLADLAKPGVKIISQASDVPVRIYTEQMLNNTAHDSYLGEPFIKAFKANIISEEANVASSTTKIALDEGDAAIAYYSDVTKDLADKITIIEIPEKYNVIAIDEAGVLTESKQPELAKEYIQLLTSDKGKAILKEYQFSPV